MITVLFIDDDIFDDENTRESYKITELERDSDIKVIPAVDGTDALKQLDKVLPDIIVLDIMMPPGDDLVEREVKGGLQTGFVLLDEIVETRRLQIPIIVLTNYPKFAPKTYQPVVEWQAKPIKMSKLAEIIRSYIINQ